MKRDTKETIEKLKVYFVSQESVEYDFVLLFGSYSSGKTDFYSDVDIAIHMPADISLVQTGTIISDLENLLDRRIDLVFLREIYKKDALFAKNIVENHQKIDIKDETKWVDFKRESMLYYFDNEPLIKMNRKALLNRIKRGKVGERNYA